MTRMTSYKKFNIPRIVSVLLVLVLMLGLATIMSFAIVRPLGRRIRAYWKESDGLAARTSAGQLPK